MKQLSRRSMLLACSLLIIAVCLITYLPVLTHEIMLDDHAFVTPKGIQSFYSDFRSYFTQADDQHYIPLYNLMNVALFKQAGSSFFLYLFNLLLFTVDALLIFFCILSLSQRMVISLLTSLIFIVHPMSAEMVQHITFNNVLITIALMLAGLMMLNMFIDRQKKVFYGLSILCVIVALLFLETSLSFVFYAAAMLFFLKRKSIQETLKISAPFIAVNVLFIVLWAVVASHKAHVLESKLLDQGSVIDLAANFFHLCVWHVSNLVAPRDVVFMYNTPPLTQGIILWCLGLVMSAGFIAAAAMYFKRSLESFALTVFVSGYLITLPAVITRPEMGYIFEPYWVAFSTIGFFFFVLLLGARVSVYLPRWFTMSTVGVIVILFFVQTQRINAIASTELSYCENWVRKTPTNSMPRWVLGEYYHQYATIPIPKEFHQLIIQIIDDYLKNGQQAKAKRLIERLSTAELTPVEHKDLIIRTAVMYYKSGEQIQGQALLEQFFEQMKRPEHFIELAQVFEKAQVHTIAIDILKHCRARFSGYKEAYLFEGVILGNQDRYQEAVSVWSQGLTLDPTDQRFIQNIAKAKIIRG